MTPEETARAFVAAWNDHDADAIAVLMTPDARFVTAFGQMHRGRSAIRDAHEGAFRRAYRDATLTTHSVEVFRERPQLGLVTVEWALADAPEGPSERGTLLLALERSGDGWRICAAQNTPRAHQ